MNAVTEVIALGRMDLIQERLATEGFRPERVSDNSIRIRCEGKSVWVDLTPSDESFFQVIAANIWELESADEVQLAFEAANHVGDSLKVVKAYVTSDRSNVWVEGSGFYGSTEEFLELMVRIIDMVRVGVSRFSEKIRELRRAAEVAKLH